MNQDVSRAKAPGDTCVGVMPVPATPTESKTPSYPSTTTANNKPPKIKEKPNISTQERPTANTDTENATKRDQKQKSSSESSRHKSLKLGEKLNDKKESKGTKSINKISLEKYKSNQASEKSLSGSKQKRAARDDEINAKSITKEPNEDVDKAVKKNEETSESSQKEPVKIEKSKPMPLLLPAR